MLNKNEFYKMTVEHLIAQGKRAVDNISNNCLYRTSDGLKCAIGVHIRDEDYTDNMETIAISQLTSYDFCPANIRMSYEAYPELMRDLQSLHDDYLSDDREYFYRFAADIAKHRRIDPAFVPDVIKEQM